MIAVGYIRVSTERQAGEQYSSLGDQQRAIEALATKLGVTVHRWYRDEGASGGTADRPEFQRMLRDCEQTRPRGMAFVLVLNTSRFGRFAEPEEAAYWRHHLRRHGWTVRFAEGDASEDKTGRLLTRAIGDAQASAYRDNLKANVKRGKRGAAEMGFWTSEAPYGFRRMVVYPPGRNRVLERGVKKATDEKVKLTPHAEEAENVRWLYEQYVSGRHSTATLEPLMRERVPGRRWCATSIKQLLSSAIYCGDIEGGKRVTSDDGGREAADRFGCRDAHEPIVSRELWLRVQHRLGVNGQRGRGARADYMLSGLVTCPHCSAPYIGGGGAHGRRHYRDRGGRDGICPGPIGCVMQWIIEGAATEILADTLATPAVQRLIVDELDAALERLPSRTDELEATLKAARGRADARRRRLIALLADGTVLRDEAAPQLEQLRAEIAGYDVQLEQLRFRGRRSDAGAAERNRLAQIAVDAPRLVRSLSGAALRDVVQLWLAGGTFDKVSRDLTLSITPLPRAFNVLLNNPADRVHQQPIIRRVGLSQFNRRQKGARRWEKFA